MIDKITGVWPVPVLPQSFDTSMSYYEALAKLQQTFDQAVDLVNELEVIVERDKIVVDGLDERITEAEEAVAEMQTAVDQMQAAVSGLSDTVAQHTQSIAMLDQYSVEMLNALTQRATLQQLADEQGAREAADSALQAAVTAEENARTSADNTLQAAINTKADSAQVFGIGTFIAADSDLFTLPTGKYYRNTAPGDIANIPADLTVAFYCEIVNTIAAGRRKIYLYPASVQTAGVFYTCLETGNGYGDWYKYSGAVVTPPASTT